MSGDAEVQLQAPDGGGLIFALTGRSAHQIDFVVSVRKDWVTASAPASTYVSGPPTTMFKEMAANWRGWEGEKTWEDLEGRVKLSAASDKTGHISVKVTLVGPDYDSRVVAVLTYEAGALESMHTQVSGLFSRYAI
jgi:hypothetical protein